MPRKKKKSTDLAPTKPAPLEGTEGACKELLAPHVLDAASVISDALTATKWLTPEEGPPIEVKDVSMRLHAAEAILDRVYGKPTQSVSNQGAPLVQINLDAELFDLFKKLAGDA